MSSESLRTLGDFSGEKVDYPDAKERYLAFKTIEKKRLKKWLGVPDPRNRSRIEADYEARTGDPTGAKPGTLVKAESPAQYRKVCEEWVEIDEWMFSVWGSTFKGGRALRAKLKLAQQGKRSGRLLEKAVAVCYEEKTARHAAHLVRSWVTTVRKPGESVEAFTEAWEEQREEINANLDWDQIQCIFYLTALGPSHQNYFDIKSQEKTLDMDDLQRGAPDFRRGTSDEDPRLLQMNAKSVALSVEEQKQNNRDRHGRRWTTRPCNVCGNQWHCARDCFDEGGGLSHLTMEERQDWLDMKKRRRERLEDENRDRKRSCRGRGDRDRRGGGRDHDEANLAQIRREVELQVQHEAQLAEIREKAAEHGMEREFSDVTTSKPRPKMSKIYL